MFPSHVAILTFVVTADSSGETGWSPASPHFRGFTLISLELAHEVCYPPVLPSTRHHLWFPVIPITMETNRGTGYRAVYDDDDELQNDDSNGGITLSPDIDCRLHYPSQCRSRDKEGRRYSVHEEPSDVPQNLRFIHYGDLLPEAVECTSRTRVSRNLLREFIKMGKSASPHKIKDASGGALLHDHAGTGQDTSRDVDAHSEAGSADSDDSTDTVTPTRTDAVSRSSSQIVSPSKLRANAPSFVPSSFKDSFDQTSEESKQPLKHLRSSSDRPDGYSSYAIPHRKSLSSGNCTS
jgi:hypothetical protein